MFGRKKTITPVNSTSSSSGMPASHALNSLVQGTNVEGNIKSTSDIRIDGSIKGTLHCDAKVIIGPEGKIDGDVFCENAVIEGTFKGKLNVKELLNIRESAKVEGEIRYGRLLVQMGATLIGDVRKHNSGNENGIPKSSKSSQKIVEAKTNGTTAVAGKLSGVSN